MAKRLTGLNPLAYLGVEALTPPALYVSISAPTVDSKGGFNLGDMWLNRNSQTLYVLVSLANSQATWQAVATGGAFADRFETDDLNVAVPVAGLLNISGGTGITTSSSGNTVTISVTGAEASSFQADSGTAAPSSGVMIMSGAGDVATSASGNTVTFTGAGVTTVNADSGSAAASSNAITIAGAGTVTTSATGSTITITGSGGGGGITTLDGDTGSATGATVTIHGGTGITTSATGSTVTINASGGAGISTITTDSGSVTGSTVSITGVPSGGGGTVRFNATSGTAFELDFSNGSACTSIGAGSFVGGGLTLNTTCVGVNAGANASSSNTLVGANAYASGSGSGNTCIGSNALSGGSGGSNISIGNGSGSNYSGSESNNVLLDSSGVASENNTLHIGNATGTGSGQLNAAFIAGIQTIVVTGTPVLVSTSDQLGVAISSKRFKSDIQDMKDASSALYNLRPVSFVWDKDSAPGLKDATDLRQYGLIAEEAVSVVPHAVNLDKDGKPFNINYQDLIGMMINEIQRLNKRIAALESK